MAYVACYLERDYVDAKAEREGVMKDIYLPQALSPNEPEHNASINYLVLSSEAENVALPQG